MTNVSPEEWGRRATALARNGELDAAAQIFKTLSGQTPTDKRAWEGLVRTQFALQDLKATAAVLDEIEQYHPDWDLLYLLRGHLDKAYGKKQSAIENYQRALRCNADNGEALFGLIELSPEHPDSEMGQKICELAGSSRAKPADRINAGFAAGRIYDAAGHYEQAFAHFREANNLARQELAQQGIRYSPQQREQEVDQRIAIYSKQSPNSALPPLPINLTPVFIVGMPRSGTTLVEQILASHPEVEAGGELIAGQDCERRFLKAREEVGREGPIDPHNQIDRSLLEEARERYIDALFERGLEGPYVVDKMPANFQLLGFLTLLFAEAPILHTVRDARATTLSLYFANFGAHEPYYHDLEHLAHYYRQYQRLMKYWQSALPGRTNDVVYEELVNDPEHSIPALLEKAGLEPHGDSMQFHRHQRPVLTASHSQVRQPIYSKAIRHWKHYQRWMGPLLTL